jgi:hypothetical protein
MSMNVNKTRFIPRTLFWYIAVLFPCCRIIAQNVDSVPDLISPAVLFKNFSGYRERINRIDNKVRWAYTIVGKEYTLHVIPFDYVGTILGKKGTSNSMANMIKKNADFSTTNVAGLPSPNIIAYKSAHLNDTILVSNISYGFPDSKDTIYYRINMDTFFQRDSSLEKNIARSIAYDGIFDPIFHSPGWRMINFADRLIKIDTGFVWEGPNNIYCPKMGQFNWSVHETLYKANVARDAQMLANTRFKKLELIKKDTVDVLFEDVKQQAVKVTYKANVPKIFWGKGSKVLIVYYVVSLRDDHFITTVLSHYDDSLINGDVPPPLNSIMSIKAK